MESKITEVSARIFASLVEFHGGRMLIQEVFGGDGNVIPHCFSLFCRVGDYASFESIKLYAEPRIY